VAHVRGLACLRRGAGPRLPGPLAPPPLLVPFAVVLFGAAVAVVLGVLRRPALWTCFLTAFYVQSADLLAAFTLNKFYIVFFFVLAVQPRPRPVELPGGGTASLQSGWALRTMQATLLIQYLTAGTCKVFHGDWLQNPDFLYTHAVGLYRTEAAVWAIQSFPHWAWWVMGYTALVYEIGAPVLFVVPRLRPAAYLVGFGLHALIALFMKDLLYFSAQMVSFYLLFVREDRVLRVEHALQASVEGFLRPLRDLLPARGLAPPPAG
jgi:hypothetical protein